MKTVVLKIYNEDDVKNIERAAEILKNGGLVAIPTETVYGLAANALDERAIERIFAAKGRPRDNPLIVHINSYDQIELLARDIPPTARSLAEAFWPGPLTLVLPKRASVHRRVSGGLDTVALRVPAHFAARAIITASGLPLAAPSANISGSPSPTCARHVLKDLDGLVDAVVDSGDCAVGVESTVLSLANTPPKLLRPGGVTPAQIRSIIGDIEIDKAVLNALDDTAEVASPGMKYKHYSPKARIILIKGELAPFLDYIYANAGDTTAVLCFEGEEPLMPVTAVPYGGIDSPQEQARRLFAALREIDEMPGIKTVYARCPDSEGLGLAVYNRLLRAAAFEVVEV